jgi:hypothetical protein
MLEWIVPNQFSPDEEHLKKVAAELAAQGMAADVGRFLAACDFLHIPSEVPAAVQTNGITLAAYQNTMQGLHAVFGMTPSHGYQMGHPYP